MTGHDPNGSDASDCLASDEQTPHFDVVSFGEPMYEFSQIPGRSREYLQGFGGDTMNCAIAAARQGARVSYLTSVGDDEFGRQMFQLWRREHVDASAVKVDPDGHTAVYFISHGPSGHTFSYLRKGSAASRFSPADLPPQLIRDCSFFHTSGISQAISQSACESVFAAIGLARAARTTVVYDANIRPSLWNRDRANEVVRQTIPLTDLLLLSLEDARFLTGSEEPDHVVEWCAGQGARATILKLGARGVAYAEGGTIREVAGFEVDAVDATGAGDCFAGALMARLARGDALHVAVVHACAAAALACTGYGAIAPLPDTAAVLGLLERNGRQH